ncbi:DNA-binding bromodomain-containing protein [Actinidia rufa]|uniref:DNA-binding bromodomain-containing protein n=1 Tax=Actinidia rufa TaxID=165716 RepID=A0A7J0G9E2_9ERIC|nr:DNA-binding bromodomain-containing protein [Actinidia rufa]
MNQIVKRKKKGRPSKADLARRAAAAAAAGTPESDGRRRLRRRNGTYNIDLDDVIDEEDDENERRREKKLKLLLKGRGESSPSRTRRVAHVPAASGSSSEYGDGDNPLKKRKIDGDDEIRGEINGGDENEIENEDDEVRRRKTGSKVADSFPETPSDPQLGLPLPDKKSLDLILDKLQKKDTYGVYAEPVDPEELPDYHDVIDHPMDFATVRKKLGNGSYPTLEQFESDVFLICSNAMQYNAPDTIYYKQEPFGSDLLSGAILATAGVFRSGSNAIHAGGFDRLTNMDGPVVGNTPLVDNSLDKADDLQGRGLLSRFSDQSRYLQPLRVKSSSWLLLGFMQITPMPGAWLVFSATLGAVAWNVASRRIEQALPPGFKFGRGWVGEYEPLSTPILMLENCSLKEPNLLSNSDTRKDDKTLNTTVPVQDNLVTFPNLEGKSSLFGATETKRTASLTVSALVPTKDQSVSGANLEGKTVSGANSDTRKDDKTLNTTVPVQDNLVTFPNLEGKSSLFGATETKRTASLTVSALVPTKDQSVSGANLEGKQPFFSGGSKLPTTSASVNYQQQIPQSRNNNPGKVSVRQVLLNCPPISAGQNTNSFVAEKKILTDLDVPASRLMENVSGNRNLLQSVPFKQPENHGGNAGVLPNGKVASNNLDRNRTIASSSDNNPNQMVMAPTYFPHGQEQGLRDPVQLMRILAENAQKLQKPLNHPPVDNPSVMPSVPSSRRDDSNNAASTAARTWMSIGAEGSKAAAENTNTHKNQNSVDSLYNSNTQLHPRVPQFRGDSPVSGIHFQPAKNSFPFQAFVAPPVRLGNEAQFQNRPMYFPQSVPADLSRFQMQSPWQGLNPHHQPRNKQESLPPDLNIGVQSSGSPVRQSSGVLVDSQQPDLALQL